ncbi:hypothetical protein EXIGLDRAFT_752504 [Exidia glandulosa HHB12029]|uniref:Uncharacterized protein n=1 Tax=Exidia glandulosa HHB12029 TaxID=1314781 RepID=A0A165EHW8_EXIGL|nr:hypothetical protein EXIGLDRAFT_752504 [Exidia glandulosa HHB12029]
MPKAVKQKKRERSPAAEREHELHAPVKNKMKLDKKYLKLAPFNATHKAPPHADDTAAQTTTTTVATTSTTPVATPDPIAAAVPDPIVAAGPDEITAAVLETVNAAFPAVTARVSEELEEGEIDEDDDMAVDVDAEYPGQIDNEVSATIATVDVEVEVIEAEEEVVEQPSAKESTVEPKEEEPVLNDTVMLDDDPEESDILYTELQSAQNVHRFYTYVDYANPNILRTVDLAPDVENIHYFGPSQAPSGSSAAGHGGASNSQSTASGGFNASNAGNAQGQPNAPPPAGAGAGGNPFNGAAGGMPNGAAGGNGGGNGGAPPNPPPPANAGNGNPGANGQAGGAAPPPPPPQQPAPPLALPDGFTPRPAGGFPIPDGMCPETVFQNMTKEQLEFQAQLGGVYAEMMGDRFTEDCAHKMDTVLAIISLATGIPVDDLEISVPIPAVAPESLERAPPHTAHVSGPGLTDLMCRRLVATEVLAHKDYEGFAIRLHSHSPARSTYAMTVEGWPTAKAHHLPIVRLHVGTKMTENPVLGAFAEKHHDLVPPNANPDITMRAHAVRYLVNNMEIVPLAQKSAEGKTTYKWIFRVPPLTYEPAAWAQLRNIISSLNLDHYQFGKAAAVYVNARAQAKKNATPNPDKEKICSICYSFSHPSGQCPYPDIPGWHGPVPNGHKRDNGPDALTVGAATSPPPFNRARTPGSNRFNTANSGAAGGSGGGSRGRRGGRSRGA